MERKNKDHTQILTEYKTMTQTPVSRLIIRLSIPTIISMMISNIYNLADTAFVGQLGNSASAAVGVVFGFMAIIQAVGYLFGQGAGNLIARKLGQQDQETASTIASTGFFFALFSGIVIAVLGFVFLDPLVIMLGSTETIAPYARIYLTYILAATPLMTASFSLNSILRYEGKASLGMIGLLAGAILNICGDPILMFGLDMGIAGAGLSTALGQTISFLILLSFFLRKKTLCTLAIRRLSLNPEQFLGIITTGLPSLLRQGLNSLTTVLLNSQSAVYGDEAVAAMSIVSRIIYFFFAMAIGISQGFQPVCGFNYGAGKYGRVKKAYRFTLLLSEWLMAVAGCIILIIPDFLVGLFRNDMTVINIGVRALRLQAVSLMVLPVCMCTEMMLQSIGRKVGAALLSSMRGGIYFIPVLLILADMRGLYGIEESQFVAYLMASVSALPFAIHFLNKLSLLEKEEKNE